MPWLQLKLRTSAEHADALSENLHELGACSVTYQDAADQALLEPAPGETPLWNQVVVTGLFEADTDMQSVELQLQEQPQPFEQLKVEILEDQDWERSWLEHFKPMSFGKHLWIVPSNQHPPEPAAANVILDPGLAFGTGTHPTTAMCLRWLDNQDLKDKQVIDYGCGSGILGIAALKLGAKKVYAVDNDPQALFATRENAIRNDVIDSLVLCKPDELPPAQAEVLVANILANPLIELAPRFSEYTCEDGRLVLSGILQSQAEVVMKTYAAYFDMHQFAQQEEWCCLEGRRYPL